MKRSRRCGRITNTPLVVLDGAVRCESIVVEPGHLAYLGTDRSEIALDTVAPARAMLLGGVPFSEQLLMWWNFVARTSQEIDGAYESWQDRDVRFGEVASRLDRISAPRPTWTSGQRER